MKRRDLLAEAVGTFALVFAGTGAIVINDITGGAVSHIGISLTFGLVILAMIYALGDISGAHFNPAVTIGFWAARRIERSAVLPYILSQCAGALLASLLLRLLFPAHESLGATQPAGPALQSFVLESVLTFLLMLVILQVSTGGKEKGITAGMAVGAVIALEALFAGPISGASMNPARSLAPALVSLHLAHLWIYILAPLTGAVGAVFVARSLQSS
ncbi:MAG: aquaporin [Nitrospirae bacterium]|nr:MAG: aquaporin [Nitrospirota bacterium]